MTALIEEYAMKYLYKELHRISEQIGHSWVQEILEDHPIRCYEIF